MPCTCAQLELTLTSSSLSYGTAVRVRGQWQKSPNGTEQNHELQAEDVKVLGSTETAVCETTMSQLSFFNLSNS